MGPMSLHDLIADGAAEPVPEPSSGSEPDPSEGADRSVGGRQTVPDGVDTVPGLPAEDPLMRADGEPPRVLVLDDEPNIRTLVSRIMEDAGWRPLPAGTGRDAIRIAATERPDAAVLDLMLPDLDGLEVMHRLRAVDPDLPVLILTARDGQPDRRLGLRAGADDYVIKPFDVDELSLRVLRLLERQPDVVPASTLRLRVDDLALDVVNRLVEVRGGDPAEIRLDPEEFRCLEILMRHPNETVPRPLIEQAVWPERPSSDSTALQGVVDRLKGKLPRNGHARVRSVPGVGYTLGGAAG